MGYSGYGTMNGSWFSGGTDMLVSWVALILAGFILVRLFVKKPLKLQAPMENTVTDIVEQRYAHGEIHQDEYKTG